MRRWLHCMIVALLCATLFTDTARACWHRRHHGRAGVCPPPACHALPAPSPPWPASFVPVTFLGDAGPAAWTAAPLAWHGDVTGVVICDRIVSWEVAVDDVLWAADDGVAVQCCVPCDGPAHDVLDHESIVVHGAEVMVDGVVVRDGMEQGGVEHVEGGVPAADVRPAEQGEAVVVHEPTIVVGTAPTSGSPQPLVGEIPAPKTARPAAPQPQVAEREPLPDLQPATAAAEQPVPASLDLPAGPDTAAASKSMPERLPQAATPDVDDLAAAPAKAVPPVERRERNLFDEFDDEPAERSESAEPEMTDQPADEEPATDEQPVKEEPVAPTPGEDPAAPQEQESTAMIVPDEPLRRWTDATGDHHAQGWLAELRDDVVRILKVNGRYTTMAVADLSDADQAYVADIAARLAVRRQSATAVNDTAGL